MPVYIDIGAVRIQEWLSRTPPLALRRGASAALSRATARAQVEKHLPDGVSWNVEAGDIDGVVNLRTDRMDDDLIRRAIAAVVGSVREDLPALDWGAGVAEGTDYYSAYRQLQRSRAEGAYAPAPARTAELPYVLPCETCGLDPASSEIRLKDEREKACRDCASRAEAAGRASGSPASEPASSRLLRDWLVAAHEYGPTARFPRSFEDLSKLDGGEATHVATIYADGNALGQAFGRAQSGAKKSELAAAIKDATEAGAVAAVRAIASPEDAETIPVIVHTIGGDDVLVSVPPQRAWQFTSAYLDAFGKSMATRMNAIFGSTSAERPKPITASAGIVHAHLKFPIGLQIEAAEAAMRKAKRAGGPDRSFVAWLDVTGDGYLADPHGPWALADVTRRWGQLDDLAGLAASQRSRLLRLTSAEFLRQVQRRGLEEVSAVGSGWQGQQSGIDEARVKEALRIVRWWS